jgi:hypothetical protein
MKDKTRGDASRFLLHNHPASYRCSRARLGIFTSKGRGWETYRGNAGGRREGGIEGRMDRGRREGGKGGGGGKGMKLEGGTDWDSRKLECHIKREPSRNMFCFGC